MEKINFEFVKIAYESLLLNYCDKIFITIILYIIIY